MIDDTNTRAVSKLEDTLRRKRWLIFLVVLVGSLVVGLIVAETPISPASRSQHGRAPYHTVEEPGPMPRNAPDGP